LSEEQIIGFLKQAEAGMSIKELCRQSGLSDAIFKTSGRAKFGGDASLSGTVLLRYLHEKNAERHASILKMAA